MKVSIRIAASIAALAALSAPAFAITWGQPDGNAHPNVVNLIFERPDGLYSCTGTLLTSTLVLTAGHCTEEAGAVNINTWVRNDANLDAAFAAERPSYASTRAWLNATWSRGQAVPHPMYDDYSQFPDTYDVGVVLLSTPIFVAQYGALPTLGQFEYLRKSRGSMSDRRAVIVGYGLQGKIPAFSQDDWVRYRGESSVANLENGNVLGAQNFQFTNSPGKGNGVGGTCSGDSGGPAFWVNPATNLETNIVMAVNSYSVTPLCNGVDYQARTDTAVTQDFVRPYLPH
jgi:hypothetical protein